MTKVYLAIGSNVGDSSAHIQDAARRLSEFLWNVKRARLYVSKPMGYTNQSNFINTAVCGYTDLAPEKLLETIKEIEKLIGRKETVRWGPREIDIDLIFYGDKIFSSPGLTVPHPHYRERDFVLRPLLDIDPDLVDPKDGVAIAQLLEMADANIIQVMTD